MKILINRALNELIALDVDTGKELFRMDHMEAVEFATDILDKAGRIRDAKEEDEEEA